VKVVEFQQGGKCKLQQIEYLKLGYLKIYEDVKQGSKHKSAVAMMARNKP